MKNTGLVTYVHGWYKDYIPLFVHAAKWAYPEYHVRIFVDEIPTFKVDAELIRFDNPHKKAVKPYYLRWLLPPESFIGLDYAFICDVDLLTLREYPRMAEIRKAIMDTTGRPYANYLRKPAPNHPERYTGWHFIDVEPYYEKVWPHAKLILEDQDFDISTPPSYGYYNGFGEWQWGQEHLLYRLIEKAFGVDREVEHENRLAFANHHGLHLGPLRGGMRLRDVSTRLPLNDRFWLNRDRVQDLIQSPGFLDLVARTHDERVRVVLGRLLDMFGN